MGRFLFLACTTSAIFGQLPATPAVAQRAIPQSELQSDISPFRLLRQDSGICSFHLRQEDDQFGRKSMSLTPWPNRSFMGFSLSLGTALGDVGSTVPFLFVLLDAQGESIHAISGEVRIEDLQRLLPGAVDRPTFNYQLNGFLPAQTQAAMANAKALAVQIAGEEVLRQELPGGGSHMLDEFDRCHAGEDLQLVAS